MHNQKVDCPKAIDFFNNAKVKQKIALAWTACLDKRKPAVSILFTTGLGFCYKKDVAVNACIFIQTKEKSPNANCVQTQPGGFALQKRYPVQNENPGSA